MKQVIIKSAQCSDLHDIAVLHKERFSDHFLGKYSVKVIEAYYLEFIKDCIFLISENDGKINGFVMGGNSNSLNIAKNAFIKNNKMLYAFDTVIRPWVYKDALSRIKAIIQLQSKVTSTTGSSVRLLSIAISNDAQGQGVAKQLLASFEKAISPWDNYGVSVLSHNKRAQAFYRKNGFCIEREEKESLYLTKVNTYK